MKRLLIIPFLLVATQISAQIISKPDIPSDKTLTKTEQTEVRQYLDGKVFKELTPVKNDYVDKNDRGTVEFNPSKGINMFGREVFTASNYSKHKIVIPDGTSMHNINFSQKNPFTDAITGKNLTFFECNLTNVVKDPTWILTDSINPQVRYKEIREGGKTYDVQEIFKGGVWIENQRSDITPIIIDE